jgi:iron uptake system component EfeO
MWRGGGAPPVTVVGDDPSGAPLRGLSADLERPRFEPKGDETMTTRRTLASVAGALSLLACALAGCGGDTSGSPESRAQATVKDQISVQLDNLVAAATMLQAAAPAPDADGWNDATDADAVAAMKTQWHAARVAYERIEGAIAVLFPDLDVSTDERYDGFIADMPDADLFDGTGVTGIHAIERILWAGHAPALVVAFESALDGYVAASFPTSMTEATEFKAGLCQRLVDDVTRMRTQFDALALDTAAAFRGVIGSMGEQVEKITLAETGEEESRYAQNTLADMRANLAGGKATYAAFADWVRSESGGAAIDADITAGFARVQALYDGVQGEALPPVPAGFDPETPTADQLATPYGMIFAGLSRESDANDSASLVARLTAAADLIGIPRLPEF